MKLSLIKANPSNPRTIKDDKFKKLVQSLKDFPQMMELRPIVVDANMVTLGGNMRLKALQDLGYKDIPDTWVKPANELTADQKREFIVKDNLGYGEFNWDELANDEWSDLPLEEWGLDLPNFNNDLVQKINEQEEWIGLPDFEVGQSPIRMLISFETEDDRQQFNDKYNLRAEKKTEKIWAAWYPYRGKEDLKSLKYE